MGGVSVGNLRTIEDRNESVNWLDATLDPSATPFPGESTRHPPQSVVPMTPAGISTHLISNPHPPSDAFQGYRLAHHAFSDHAAIRPRHLWRQETGSSGYDVFYRAPGPGVLRPDHFRTFKTRALLKMTSHVLPWYAGKPVLKIAMSSM